MAFVLVFLFIITSVFKLSKSFDINNSTFVYVSKNGIDSENNSNISCGSFDNPCGTFYFGSTLLDLPNNVSTIYIIDGQNETEIQLYIDTLINTNITNNNNTNRTDYIHYHPCLPKQPIFDSLCDANNNYYCYPKPVEFTIIFDDVYIKSMRDWYPAICDNPYIINSITKNNYVAFFDQIDFFASDFVPKINFVNLMLDHYHFTYLTVLGYSGHIETQFTCYNCRFINISFSCSQTTNASTHLISADIIHLNNVEIANVYISCNSSSSSSSSMFDTTITLDVDAGITFENVQISNVWTQHSLFKTQNENILINNCLFSNIHTGYDIFGEHIFANSNLTITNSNFSYIDTAIYRSNFSRTAADKLSQLYVHIENVNFIIENAGTETGLFELDLSTNIIFNNVNVFYQYNLSQHCQPPSFLPFHGYHNVLCKNPQSLVMTYGVSQLLNVSLNSDMNQVDNLNSFHQFVAGISLFEFDSISYSFASRTDDYGLITNFGDSYNEMVISDMTISPFTFHRDVIVSTKSIILNNVNVIHDDDTYTAYNYSHLESDTFLRFINAAVSGIPKQISIINCHLDGVRQVLVQLQNSNDAIFETFNIIDSSFYNAPTFFAVVNVQQIHIENSYFVNAYGLMLEFENIDYVTIKSSYFYSYGESSMVYIDISKIVEMENNTFKLTDDLSLQLLSVIETEYNIDLLFSSRDTASLNGGTLTFAVYLQHANSIRLISNNFGFAYYEDTAAVVMWKSNACLSGNIFHNYGMHTDYSNVTSCYKEQMLLQCPNNNNDNITTPYCCDHYGAINQDLMDTTAGYFILNDSNSEPITSNRITGYKIYNGIALENVVFQVIDNRTQLLLPFARHLLFTDVVIESVNANTGPVDFAYIETYCNLLCNQLMNSSNSNSVFRTQINMECGGDYLGEEKLSSLEWNGIYGTQMISHATPHSLLLNPSKNGSYFPGQSMAFTFNIVDKFGHNIINYTQAIKLTLTVNISNIAFPHFISITDFGYCLVCDSGIYISSITLAEIGDTFVLLTQDQDNTLIIPDFEITVVNCPRGHGKDTFNAHCYICAQGFYQLFDDFQGDCKNCKHGDYDDQDGFNCVGGDNIIISQHNWIAVQGITDTNLFDYFENDNILSSFCPYNYCCQLVDGCNYLLDAESLCALNRDSDVPLCGKCLVNYSESMNSPNCTECSDRNIYFEWLLVPISVSMMVALYLLATKSRKVTSTPNIKPDRKPSDNMKGNAFKQLIKNKRFLLMVQVMFAKIIIYYEQSLSQILLSGSIVVNLSTFSAFFDLSVISSQTNANGWCFINGLTAKGKILCNLISPFLTSILVIFAALSINKMFKSRNVPIVKTLFALLLLCIGQILSIVFKYLSCQQIGNDSQYFVHFYFGNERCYGSTWLISLMVLILIILFFMYLFVKLKRMPLSEKQNHHNPLFVFIKSYKPQYYYWESVILVRRIIVIFIAVSFKSKFSTLALVIILCGFLFLQHTYQPFILHEINQMEFILLVCLISAISTQILLTAQADYVAAYVLLSFFIVIPFILIFYFTCLTFYKIKIGKQSKNENINFNLSLFKQRVKYFMLSVIVWLYYQNGDANDVIDQHDDSMAITRDECIELEQILDDIDFQNIQTKTGYSDTDYSSKKIDYSRSETP